MQLVEIRDLDGPNIFMLEPAIKVEFALDAADKTADTREALASRLGLPRKQDRTGDIPDLLKDAILAIHQVNEVALPEVAWIELETPGHEALAFSWNHRRFALGVAKLIADAATGPASLTVAMARALGELLTERQPDDAPLMVRDADRTMPTITITGTNGKTTTTRLIAHILRQSGRRAGWSSSSGVFIEGVQVMDGDYTGPAGALRVLSDPDVDVAVLETARGGILLRGIAYESNDVSVFTNVSADHLDLLGVRTVEGLADVKATVIRITKPDGFAVLNADDPLVVKQAAKTNSQLFFVSQQSGNTIASSHAKEGGNALIVDHDDVIWWNGGHKTRLTAIEDIPISFGGSAHHMLENALCGAAACLGLGLSAESVRDGLTTFSSTPTDNLGRLNLYDVRGTTVVVDFAHNEAGLRHLLMLATGLKESDASLTAIIGTAGDRTDANLEAIGRIAAESADRVIVKETKKYLRGRANNDELNENYVRGIKAAGKREWMILPSELDALKTALEEAKSGDVIALMCVEQVNDVHDFLKSVGAPSALGQARAG